MRIICKNERSLVQKAFDPKNFAAPALQATHLKLLVLTDNGMLGCSNPDPLNTVEFSGQSRRITDDHRVRWKAPSHQGICCYNTVPPDHEFTLTTYDCSAVANPASLLDSNCASGGGALSLNRLGDVLVSMVVIHDECAGRNHDVALQVNIILGGDHRLCVDDAMVVNGDLDPAVGTLYIDGVEPGIIPDNHEAPHLDTRSHSPGQHDCGMDRQIAA
jgi:hypothetical protein